MANSSIKSSKNALPRLPQAKPNGRMLPLSFYGRDTVRVAKEVLGKVLWVRDRADRWVAGRIVETEAYHGDDPASHSARGETERSAIMFGDPGRAYVYFIYGMYEMLNFVTERKGYPGAVLIRALEPLVGLERMGARRNPGRTLARRRAGTEVLSRATSHSLTAEVNWTNGPGKLCRALGIALTDNGQVLNGARLQVRDDGFVADNILVSPRVGIQKGQETPWRFYLADHSFVSRAPQNKLGVLMKAGHPEPATAQQIHAGSTARPRRARGAARGINGAR